MPHTFEYRSPETDGEKDDLARILSEAFNAPPEKLKTRYDLLGIDNVRMLKHDHHVAGGLWIVPMGQWFGGRSVPMHGIAAVGIGAPFRGRGAARELMARTVNDLHDRGVALSGLYPATVALYRTAGYELAGSRFHFAIDARKINVRERNLEVRYLTEDDRAAVMEVHRAFAALHNGHLDRKQYIWDRVFAFRDEPTRGLGVYRDGDLVGYVYYLMKDREGGYHLSLTDLAFLDAEAGRRLLGLLADHSSMTGEIRWMGGGADPITQILPELNYQVELRMHWMTRITHVEAALAARGYSPAVAAKIHLDVVDEVIPANTGRYILGVSGGAAMVEPGGRGEIRLDIRALAALYTGFQSATALRLTGRLQGSDEAVAAADGVFAGPAPCMPDMF